MAIDHAASSTQADPAVRRDWPMHRHNPDRSGPPRTAEINDLSFWDVLDVINPLQHIPLLSIAYREITGDEIHPSARVLGGALYGGPLGLMAGAMNAAFEQETGRDIAGNAMAVLRGEDLGGGQPGGEEPGGVAPDRQLAEASGAGDRPLPALDLPPVPAAETPGRPHVVSAPPPAAAEAATEGDAPPLPRLDLGPAAGSPPGDGGAVADRPVRVDDGLDAALRTLADTTGAPAAARAADVAAAYRAHQPSG
jgi:hypothetical protein